MVDSTEAVALIGGLASAVAVVATSVRKRQDVDVDEMRQRVSALARQLEEAEQEIGRLRGQLVVADGRIFNLTRLLASHGISDPTFETRTDLGKPS